MSRPVKMRALMSLPKKGGRAAVERGKPYQATEQEALDDVRMERGERAAVEKMSVPEKAKI